jgi:hypothetical protein
MYRSCRSKISKDIAESRIKQQNLIIEIGCSHFSFRLKVHSIESESFSDQMIKSIARPIISFQDDDNDPWTVGGRQEFTRQVDLTNQKTPVGSQAKS